jgi:hypothetical protein
MCPISPFYKPQQLLFIGGNYLDLFARTGVH